MSLSTRVYLLSTHQTEMICMRVISRCVHFRSSLGAAQNLPRITCPKKLKEKFEHRQRKLFSKRNLFPKGNLLISCKRKSYNFYDNQRFDSSDVQSLVSCGWKNKRRVGDYFTLVSHSENLSLNYEDDVSFRDLGLNEQLCLGLEELGLEYPTEIQKRAIPTLMKGENALCAAETGSGKTLAYLLPAVEWALKQNKELSQENGQVLEEVRCRAPNTIILTPNRELTHQVMTVAESLTRYADYVPFCLSGSLNGGLIPKNQPMDVLISTPGMLQKNIKEKRIKGQNLQHVVIDESDTLLDDSFASDIQDIFKLFHITPQEVVDSSVPQLGGTQIVLFSATVPRSVDSAIGNIVNVEYMRRITTEGVHRLQPHVQQKFFRVSPSSKPEKLLALTKGSDLATIIFVNNNNTCYFVYKLLQENNIPCLKLNGYMSREERTDVLQRFQEGYFNILVATDIASRGLDTVNVQRVINYDFPSFISDYIHRAGRVGRVGVNHPCHVLSFISHKWQVDLLWKIELAARSNRKLEHVNANIKQALRRPFEKFEEEE